jgi:hypothetical protein
MQMEYLKYTSRSGLAISLLARAPNTIALIHCEFGSMNLPVNKTCGGSREFGSRAELPHSGYRLSLNIDNRETMRYGDVKYIY